MRFYLALSLLVGIAWLAIQRGHPLAVERLGRRAGVSWPAYSIRSVLRKDANLLGLWACLAVMNRGLPNKRIVQDVSRSAVGDELVVPNWAGRNQPIERVPFARRTTSNAPSSS